MFEEFIGKNVKCCYTDYDQHKIARGELKEIEGDLIKISGKLGTLIINKNSIVKMGIMKNVRQY